jgi:hypothetical protein
MRPQFASGALALVLAAVLVITGFDRLTAQPTATPIPKAFLGAPITVHGIATPEQMMRVVEGTPFTVPAGKLFVVTGLASTGFDYAPGPAPRKQVQLLLNGQPALAAMMLDWQGGGSYAGGGPTIAKVPPGFVAVAGSTVTAVDASVNDGIALGYLVDV